MDIQNGEEFGTIIVSKKIPDGEEYEIIKLLKIIRYSLNRNDCYSFKSIRNIFKKYPNFRKNQLLLNEINSIISKKKITFKEQYSSISYFYF